MASDIQTFEQYLRQSTVKIKVSEEEYGTGFFVAPGIILTCAHVAQLVGTVGAKIIIKIFEEEQEYQAIIKQIDLGTIETSLDMHYPDIALVELIPPFDNHYCVYLDENQPVAAPNASIFSTFGYTADSPNGNPVGLTCEGRTGRPEVLKFQAGQIPPGMSGAPAFNQETRKVCGIINYSRDTTSPMGGYAIPIDVIYCCWPELHLKELHDEYHQKNPYWKKLLSATRTLQSPVERTIKIFEYKSDKLIFIIHGIQPDCQKIKDGLYEHLQKKKEKSFLLLDIKVIKYDDLLDILCGIVQQTMAQLIEKLEVSDQNPQWAETLWILNNFKYIQKSPTKKMADFINLIYLSVCEKIIQVCKNYSIIIVILHNFEQIGESGSDVKQNIIDPLLEKLKKANLRNLRFIIQCIDKPKLYDGSSEIYNLANVYFHQFIE